MAVVASLWVLLRVVTSESLKFPPSLVSAFVGVFLPRIPLRIYFLNIHFSNMCSCALLPDFSVSPLYFPSEMVSVPVGSSDRQGLAGSKTKTSPPSAASSLERNPEGNPTWREISSVEWELARYNVLFLNGLQAKNVFTFLHIGEISEEYFIVWKLWEFQASVSVCIASLKQPCLAENISRIHVVWLLLSPIPELPGCDRGCVACKAQNIYCSL